MKREMRSQIRTLYNDELDNQIDATLTYLDKNLTNIQRDTAEKRQKVLLILLLRMKNSLG